MSLRKVVSAPFSMRDTDTVSHVEFVFSLSRDKDWYSPDGAEEILEAAAERDLVTVDDEDEVEAEFDYSKVDLTDFSPPDAERLVRSPEVFDVVLDRVVAEGFDKRETVAEINTSKRRLGAVNIHAAALYVAETKGVDVDDLIDDALGDLVPS
ncbi:MAG: DUF2240 family protein [Halobacteria archaeon]|nr:DUF2240 family protein [Halobacteria archaeon]